MALQVRDKWGIFPPAPASPEAAPAEVAGLTGLYRHRVDRDFRLYLPAPFRVLGPTLALIPQPDRTLRIDSPARLSRFRPTGTPSQAAACRRYLAGSALLVPLDRRGRFTLPPPLRQWAQVQRQVVLIGQEDHLVLWALERWEAHLRKGGPS